MKPSEVRTTDRLVLDDGRDVPVLDVFQITEGRWAANTDEEMIQMDSDTVVVLREKE
ncbi:hypothetical protein SEA_WOLLYPOG_42 [Arthrobacter phage Wollypog]|uniref:Uncharacterized protein n=1 Tax=Arthrobacter phage Wollypog TaxID=2790985 RepID=A0A7T3KCK0_9CAUD|nr:hypothetical protein PP291_gp42 [Arthrobacter phage Wollypog]QPX62594.1 hypothetical protein SEA_WOLLYPOG_42 [Arthrobacter phage Wollypog]